VSAADGNRQKHKTLALFWGSRLFKIINIDLT